MKCVLWWFCSGVLLAQVPQPLPLPSVGREADEPSIEQLIDQGHLYEARFRLGRLVTREGQSARTLFLEGMILHKQGDYLKSNDKLKESFDLEPKNAGLLKLVGLNLVFLKKNKMALPFFEEAVKLAPSDTSAQYYLGMSLLEEMAYDSAVKAFEEAIRLRPAYVDAYCSLGVVKEQQGDYEAALEAYRKAAEIRDRFLIASTRPELSLGRLLVWLQRYEESLPVLDRGLRQEPDSSELLFSLGEAHYRLGHIEEAATALEKAASINPSHKRTHYYLMRIYHKLGRSDDAQRETQLFRELEAQKRARH